MHIYGLVQKLVYQKDPVYKERMEKRKYFCGKQWNIAGTCHWFLLSHINGFGIIYFYLEVQGCVWWYCCYLFVIK